MYKSALTVFVT